MKSITTDNKIHFFPFSLLLIISIIVIYFTPIVKPIFLSFTLFFFFKSKPKWDYFWVFFFLVFIDNPGNLFWQMTTTFIEISIIELSLLQCFIITSFLKILLKHNLYTHVMIFFSRESKLFLLWLCFLLLQGLLLGIEGGGSTGFRYYYYFGLTFIIYPIFFVMPHLIRSLSDLIKLYKLMSIFVLLSFSIQIYNVIFGQSLHTLLGGTIPLGYDESTTFETAEKMLRPIYFVYSSYFVFILSTFFIYTDKIDIKKSFLYFNLCISLFSIIITGTRGWIIAFSLYLLFLMIYDLISSRKFVPQKIGLIALFLSIILVLTSPIIQTQLVKSYERLRSVELILQGDITAGGTNVRLTRRLEPVLDKFIERPITGWGFSKVGMESHDGHVGFLSPLMIGGVIGGMIIVFFLSGIVRRYFSLYKKLNNSSIYKRSILVLISTLIILLTIHFTSTQVFGYFLYVQGLGSGAMWIAIYLAILNIVYFSALSEYRGNQAS